MIGKLGSTSKNTQRKQDTHPAKPGPQQKRKKNKQMNKIAKIHVRPAQATMQKITRPVGHTRANRKFKETVNQTGSRHQGREITKSRSDSPQRRPPPRPSSR